MENRPCCLALSARVVLRLFVLGLFVSVLAGASSAADANTGTITGTVSNAGTGNLLNGANVEVPALGLATITDATGRFTLAGVPAGAHEVVVSYTGLDAARATARVTSGQRTALSFDLTTQIYQLSEFRVSGEREGNAASITRQRNAPNVRSVVALDALGNLPNESPGELLIRLPGIAGSFDDEGNVTGVSIRGMAPGFNAVSIDGNQQASAGGIRA